MSATSSKPSVVREWLPRLLSGRPHQVIGAGSPYMLRWYVIPRNPLFNVYVHKFLRSDDDRALHDHPWWFVSLILRGGYVEISAAPDGRTTALCRTSVFDWRSPFRSRMLAFRPATYRHRVSLPHELRQVQYTDGSWSRDTEVCEIPCWTLIVTGRRRRIWGFWCKYWGDFTNTQRERFIPWQEFGDAGCGETA